MTITQKATSVVTHSVERTLIKFTVLGAGEIVLDTQDLSEEILQQATIHGLVQRLSDRAAISRNPETGLPATPADKLERMRELRDWYASGATEWKMNGGGGTGARGLLQMAMEEFRPENSSEEIKEWLKGLNRKEKLALLEMPEIKAIADRLRKPASAGVNTAELLKGLLPASDEVQDGGETE